MAERGYHPGSAPTTFVHLTLNLVAMELIYNADGNVDNFNIYLKDTTDGVKLKCGIYTDVAGVPTALVANSEVEITYSTATGEGWYTGTYAGTKPVLVPTTSYWLAYHNETSQKPTIGYAAITAASLYVASAGYTLPATFPGSATPLASYRFAAYITVPLAATIDVTNYGAHADGTTNDADHIQAAIDDAIAYGPGKTVVFGAATYLIDETLVIMAATSLTLSGATATIKTGTNYDGYYVDGVVGLYVDTSTGVTFDGLTFDANKAGTAAEFVFAKVLAATDVAFNNCTFKNSNYHAVRINGPATNLSFTSCAFTDNCTATGNDSDVYTSGTSTFSFTSCTFVRTRESQSQALYIDSGDGVYTNNVFTGPATAYDFRSGVHTITGGSGTVGTVIRIQSGAAIVHASGLNFECDLNLTTNGTAREGVDILTGRLVLLDSVITASSDVGANGCDTGLRIRATGVVIAKRCTFANWGVFGLRVVGTDGSHIMYRCIFSGPVAASGTGVYSATNTGLTKLIGNTRTSFAVDINNIDGKVKTITHWRTWRKGSILLTPTQN